MDKATDVFHKKAMPELDSSGIVYYKVKQNGQISRMPMMTMPATTSAMHA